MTIWDHSFHFLCWIKIEEETALSSACWNHFSPTIPRHPDTQTATVIVQTRSNFQPPFLKRIHYLHISTSRWSHTNWATWTSWLDKQHNENPLVKFQHAIKIHTSRVWIQTATVWPLKWETGNNILCPSAYLTSLLSTLPHRLLASMQ